jgi:hypothetical protein
MARTTFHKIKFKNFLSTGNSPLEYQLDQHSHTLITAVNGSGKCLDAETEIEININNPEVEKIFKDYLYEKNKKCEGKTNISRK